MDAPLEALCSTLADWATQQPRWRSELVRLTGLPIHLEPSVGDVTNVAGYLSDSGILIYESRRLDRRGGLVGRRLVADDLCGRSQRISSAERERVGERQADGAGDGDPGEPAPTQAPPSSSSRCLIRLRWSHRRRTLRFAPARTLPPARDMPSYGT